MPDAELADRLLARNRAAVSEALNLIDDRRPDRRAQALALLAELERRAAGQAALRIGITGAPGAGKSMLLDACVRALRAGNDTVGVIAVDPSSQRSGGALLGDRFRMRSSARDPGVFVRSMAARERLGGLADATYASIEVLSAVFDVVFVETVGVGQSEADIARQVDTLVFVAQPGAGDMLQFMKAGLLELPDIFVVNKADLGAVAERTASELGSGLGLGERKTEGWEPPVLLVSARDARGIDGLLEAVRAHRRHLDATGALSSVRQQCRAFFVEEALAKRYGSFGLDTLGGREGVRKQVATSEGTTFALLGELGEEIEGRLSGEVRPPLPSGS